jgi:hypothetical protein
MSEKSFNNLACNLCEKLGPQTKESFWPFTTKSLSLSYDQKLKFVNDRLKETDQDTQKIISDILQKNIFGLWPGESVGYCNKNGIIVRIQTGYYLLPNVENKHFDHVSTVDKKYVVYKNECCNVFILYNPWSRGNLSPTISVHVDKD